MIILIEYTIKKVILSILLKIKKINPLQNKLFFSTFKYISILIFKNQKNFMTYKKIRICIYGFIKIVFAQQLSQKKFLTI